MKDGEFHTLAEQQFQAIEDGIEASGVDIDCERQGNVLTLTFENKSKIIINTQAPLHQIWVATRANGFHFDYQDGVWIDNRQGNELMTLLSAACSSQADDDVELLS